MSAESSKVEYPQVQIKSDVCTELQIPLLHNEEQLCWFDAGNFALFHKPRPEFDAFFEKYKTDEDLNKLNKIILNKNIIFEKKDIELLENIYNHFNGRDTKSNGYLRSLIKDFRENQTFINFLKAEKTSKKYILKNNFTLQSIYRTYYSGPGGYKIYDTEIKNQIQFNFEKDPKNVIIKSISPINSLIKSLTVKEDNITEDKSEKNKILNFINNLLITNSNYRYYIQESKKIYDNITNKWVELFPTNNRSSMFKFYTDFDIIGVYYNFFLTFPSIP